MRVLVAAYACEPGAGSEPAVAWNWIRQVAEFSEVWVMTRSSNRKTIESALEEVPKSAHFVYLDLPKWVRFWKKGRRGVHSYYCLWQVLSYWAGRSLQHRLSFDLVHQLTLGSSWLPTFLWKLPVPFLWGPIGAGTPSPKGYRAEFSAGGRLNESVRGYVGDLMRLEPIHRAAEDRAAVILATSPETARSVAEHARQKVVLFPQVGLDPEEIGRKAPERRRLRLVSVGRLVHWKGVSLGVKAFAKLRERGADCEYWIVGDGPERSRLRRLAGTLGVADSVHFAGMLSRHDYLRVIAESDVLLYPSVHEPGAFAIVEAMATGLPVVCLDIGEPALLVTPETGFRIRAAEASAAIGQIAHVCESLARDRRTCRRMGEAARQRAVAQFSWRAKAAQMRHCYELTVRRGQGVTG